MNLGRIVQHDPRSLGFRTRHAGAPVVYADHRRYGSALDQDFPVPLGSCTGNAAAGVLNTHGFVGSRLMTEEDAVGIYADATQIDGFGAPYPPNDRGSSGLAVARILKARGLISRYEHGFSLNDALAGLGRGPGMLGINWYDSFDSPVGPDAEIRLSPNAVVRGGHELEVTAVYPQAKLIKLWNSWGRGWGNRGTAMMSFSTLERLLAERGDIVFPIK